MTRLRIISFCFLFCLVSITAYSKIQVELPDQQISVEQETLKRSRALFVQGVDLYTNERFDQAKEILKEVLKDQQDNTLVHFFLASSYDELGDYLNAKLHYEKAIDLEPSNFYALMGLAKLYSKQKNYKASLLLYDEVLEYKDVARVYVAKANVYFLMEDLEQAMKLYQKALSKDIAYSPAYFNLGNIYLFIGEHRHALRNYKNAVKYNPKSINGRLYLAMVHNYLGEKEEALKQFLKLKELLAEKGEDEGVSTLEELVSQGFPDIQPENAY